MSRVPGMVSCSLGPRCRPRTGPTGTLHRPRFQAVPKVRALFWSKFWF